MKACTGVAAGQRLEMHFIDVGQAAADTVTRLEQAEQEALTAWTSRLSALQTELQAARLLVRQAEAKWQQAVTEQWVRSPLVGQVVDVRVVDVSIAGVTLEIVSKRKGSAKSPGCLVDDHSPTC